VSPNYVYNTGTRDPYIYWQSVSDVMVKWGGWINVPGTVTASASGSLYVTGCRVSLVEDVTLDALIGQPEVAILDELTAGLDPEARRETWALIEGVRASGVTIVLATHSGAGGAMTTAIVRLRQRRSVRSFFLLVATEAKLAWRLPASSCVARVATYS
jgi:hypothetical protein